MQFLPNKRNILIAKKNGKINGELLQLFIFIL